jgi:hypothetical protein
MIWPCLGFSGSFCVGTAAPGCPQAGEEEGKGKKAKGKNSKPFNAFVFAFCLCFLILNFFLNS